MRFAEVSDGDRTIDRGDDLGQLDIGGLAGECVTAADTALGTDEAGSLQREKNLLEIGLGQTGAFCDVANRRRAGLRLVEGQAQKSPTRIVTTGRNTHASIVGVRGEKAADDTTATAVLD